MLPQGTFIKKKYNKLLAETLLGSLAYAINLMTDSLVSGNQLGEVALQAVSIVYPLYSVICFFGYLTPLGISVLYGKAVGSFKKEEAGRIAGTGLLFSVLIGIAVAAGLWLMRNPFLRYYGCTGVLFQEAVSYYNWMIALALIAPLSDTIYYLLVTDGDAMTHSIAGIASIVTNVVLSIVLAQSLGIAGLGLATFLAALIKTATFGLHFFKKTNSIHAHFCLDWKIIQKAVVLSLSDYVYYLFLAVVDIVINKVVIVQCGIEYIPAYSVINLAFSIFEVYNSINNATIGFTTCFLGEKNNHSMYLLFRYVTRSLLIMSVTLTALFFFGAPLVPTLYGLETEVTVKAAVMASRLMAFGSLGFGAIYVITSLSSSVEKPGQSAFASFLNDVFAPLLLSVILVRYWGFTGVTIGMAISSYVALAMYYFVLVLRKGKKGFPIYPEDYGEEGISFDLLVTPTSLVELRDSVTKQLTQHGYSLEHTDVLIEELFTRMMEKNPGKNVLAECTLLFGEEQVRLIIRDDGVLFNFVNENNLVESLNAHVLNSLLEQTKEKNYLVTTSFNRNGFVFSK